MTEKIKPEKDDNTTEAIIFESRKSVFKLLLVYFTLTILILFDGLVLAFFISDFLGALVIVTCTMLNTALIALAMFLQTKPLQIEMDRLKALKEDE